MQAPPVAVSTAKRTSDTSDKESNVAAEATPILTDNAFNLALTNYGHIEQQAALSATKSALLVAAHALLSAVYVGLIKDYDIFKEFAWKLEAWLFFFAGITLLVGFLQNPQLLLAG